MRKRICRDLRAFSDNKCPLFTRLGGGVPKADIVCFSYRFSYMMASLRCISWTCPNWISKAHESCNDGDCFFLFLGWWILWICLDLISNSPLGALVMSTLNNVTILSELSLLVGNGWGLLRAPALLGPGKGAKGLWGPNLYFAERPGGLSLLTLVSP